MLNKNERDGKIDEVKGHVKQAVGTILNNDQLKAEGRADEMAGKVESAAGRVSRNVGDAIASFAKGVKDRA